MRITFSSIRDGVNAINTAASQLAAAQMQVSNGKRINAPSDDPRAAQRVINSQATIDALDAYKSVAESAGSRLSAIDSALGDVVDPRAHSCGDRPRPARMRHCRTWG